MLVLGQGEPMNIARRLSKMTVEEMVDVIILMGGDAALRLVEAIEECAPIIDKYRRSKYE